MRDRLHGLALRLGHHFGVCSAGSMWRRRDATVERTGNGIVEAGMRGAVVASFAVGQKVGAARAETGKGRRDP